MSRLLQAGEVRCGGLVSAAFARVLVVKQTDGAFRDDEAMTGQRSCHEKDENTNGIAGRLAFSPE